MKRSEFMRYSAHGECDARGSEHVDSGRPESADRRPARAPAHARTRSRAFEAADRSTAAHAVWAEVGEARTTDRTAGVATRRTATGASRRLQSRGGTFRPY